jgi:hypothetical protein
MKVLSTLTRDLQYAPYLGGLGGRYDVVRIPSLNSFLSVVTPAAPSTKFRIQFHSHAYLCVLLCLVKYLMFIAGQKSTPRLQSPGGKER